MELKQHFLLGGFAAIGAFNQTRMELKLKARDLIFHAGIPFNQTRMELKLTTMVQGGEYALYF